MTDLLDAGFATGTEEDPLTLDQMGKIAPGAPPQQLTAEDCTPGWSLRPDGAIAGRLPGWGIVFGGYPQKGPTQALLSKSLKQIPPSLRAGRQTVVLRQYQDVRSYRAVIVGLTAGQAGDACRALWQAGSYCLALTPAVLNNPKAAWR